MCEIGKFFANKEKVIVKYNRRDIIKRTNVLVWDDVWNCFCEITRSLFL